MAIKHRSRKRLKHDKKAKRDRKRRKAVKQ